MTILCKKDWTFIKSHEWDSGFYVAVIGHLRWNQDINSTVPYSMAVTFEAVDEDLEIYVPIVLENEVQVELEVDVRQDIG